MISFSHFLLCSFTLFASGTLHAAPSSTKPKTPKPGVLRPQDVVAASSTKAPAYTPEISHAFDPQSAPAISPNGRILAVPRGDVWLYRTETGELLKKIPTKTARYGIAFSPDGNRLAIGIAGPDQQPVYPPKLGAGVIEIWNWTTNKVEKILPSYTYTPFRYSLDGAWIETDQVTSRALLPHSNGWKTDQPRLKAFDGAIFTRWNVEKTEASRAVHVSHLPAAFAADGTAALTFDSNGATGIYSPAEIPAAMNVAGDLPSPKRQFPIDERTSFVALSPDATVLLQNTNNMELRRFDVATGTAGASIRGAYPEGYVGFTGDNILVTSMFGFKSMAYDLDANRVLWQDKDFSRPTVAPDGHVAVYARVPAGNRVQVELQVVSARSGEAIRRIPGAISTTPSRFALAPDGKSVALARGNRVEIRDLPSLKMTRRLSGFPGGIMARTLVWNAANNKLWVFDGPGDGSMVVNLPQPPKPEGVRRFDLLDGAHEGALKWDVDSKTASPALAVSFDGRRVAASDDKEIGVWNAQSGELKWKAAVKGMRYLAFSPDGKTVVASSDYNALEPASLWNAESGTKIRDLEISTPRAPSFSPDGQM
jgi:WD40 repeat protein